MDKSDSYNIKKSLSKKEVAAKLEICMQTLCNWLNVRYYEELYKLGYRKHDKLLTPPVLEFLFRKLDIS